VIKKSSFLQSDANSAKTRFFFVGTNKIGFFPSFFVLLNGKTGFLPYFAGFAAISKKLRF
jgi:hypothetical protein